MEKIQLFKRQGGVAEAAANGLAKIEFFDSTIHPGDRSHENRESNSGLMAREQPGEPRAKRHAPKTDARRASFGQPTQQSASVCQRLLRRFDHANEVMR